jgi:hypothetical protein
MTNSNIFGGRLFAALFAVMLSAAMVYGSVGPAFNTVASSQQLSA